MTAEVRPQAVQWPDKRPLYADFLASSEARFHSAGNPRGWFCLPAEQFIGYAGVENFRAYLLQHAMQVVTAAVHAGAQGVVTWDLEGQEFPQGVSYLGDPRSLPPEMEACADQYFASLRAAGLRVGVCLRPTLCYRPVYGETPTHIAVENTVKLLKDKITYAKQRWGCTLFYVDSNVYQDVAGTWRPLPFEWVWSIHDAHPDVLLIPEHETPDYYRYSAPYQSVAANNVTAVPADVRQRVRGAWGVFEWLSGELRNRRAEAAQCIREGSIILFKSVDDAPAVKAVYEEAGK